MHRYNNNNMLLLVLKISAVRFQLARVCGDHGLDGCSSEQLDCKTTFSVSSETLACLFVHRHIFSTKVIEL